MCTIHYIHYTYTYTTYTRYIHHTIHYIYVYIDFKAYLEKGIPSDETELLKLWGEVKEFAQKFPTIGF